MELEKIISAVRLCGSTPNVLECSGQCAFYKDGDMMKCIPAMTKAAADAMERLIKERDMARAERDAVQKAYIAELEGKRWND